MANQLTVIARAAGSTDASTVQGSSSSSTALSDDARAFLQRRVASVGRVLAAIFGTFLGFRLTATVLEPGAYGTVDVWAAVPYLVIATTSFLTLWLWCRSGSHSLAAIRRIEALCLFVGCTAVTVMPFHIPYSVRPDYVVVMALGMVLIARAVYVPSTARRTLAMGAVMGVAMLSILYLVHYHGHDPAHYTALAQGFVHDSPTSWAVRWTIVDLLWWTSFVALGGATSHVIYGLRAQVRDAHKLGQYTLVEKLGEGGMGAVYKANHAMLRRPAAVKLLLPDRFGEGGLARFEREVQLTAVLTHPNTVRVFDYGRTPDGVFYYAMEFIDGANLAEIVAAAGAMPTGRVVHILDRVAGALAEAHGIGLIHRDIKPANILLTAQGSVPDIVKVVDFGLVKELAPEPSGDGATVPAITQANSVAGTPHYMAPEAISAPAKANLRSDIYAVGAVGYYLLTARDVFSGRNSFEVFGHHLHSTPVPPSERLGQTISADLEKLILSCLEKDPARRPADARTLQCALRCLRDAPSWTEDDARQWWAEHGDQVRSKRVRSSVGTQTTFAVDLGVRVA